MGKAKHTPGPWSIEFRGDRGNNGPASFTVIHGPKGNSDWVADVGLLHNGKGSGSKANANLISSAPELLDALKMAVNIIGHPDDAMTKHMVSVIAKAEGRNA